MSTLGSRSPHCSARQAALRLVAPAVLSLLMPGSAWSQSRPALPGCPFNLCATGVELGNAQGLARWANPQSGPMCSEIIGHIRQAELHLPQVNRTCAQDPSPPWPAFQNWRGMQSQWESFWQQYGRGRPWCPGGSDQFMIVFDHPVGGHDGMNDSQLYFEVGAWWQNLAASLRYTAVDRRPGVLQVQTDINDTCGGFYLAMGAYLGNAQVTLQLKPASASYAYGDAIDKYQLAMQALNREQSQNSPRGVTRCGDFRAVLGMIERIVQGGRAMGGELERTATQARQTYLDLCQAAAAPTQGLTYEQCLAKYCPECSQSISLLGVSAGANCEACKRQNERLISACAAGGGTGAGPGSASQVGTSLSLSASAWQRAPGFVGTVSNAQGGLLLQAGAFTNGKLVNGAYDGNRVLSRDTIDLSSGGDVYAAFAPDGAGKYLVLWPRLHSGVPVPAFTTDHSWANSILIPQGGLLYGHLRVDRGGRYQFTVAVRGYDNHGGQIIHQSGGTTSKPVGQLDFQFMDNYAGTSASLLIKEVWVYRDRGM